MENVKTTTAQNILRIVLAIFMILAGIGHLSFQRTDFQAQVPNWFPMNKDTVVLLSGVVEIAMGLLLLFYKSKRAYVGMVLAVFYVLVFPGNIAQYVNGIDAFGLNSDKARLARLFFQPVLILWALWSSGALRYFTLKRNTAEGIS